MRTQVPHARATDDERVLASGWDGRLEIESIDAFRLTRERAFISDAIVSLLDTAAAIEAVEERERAAKDAAERARHERRVRYVAEMECARQSQTRVFSGMPNDIAIRSLFDGWPDWLRHVPTDKDEEIPLPLPPEMWQSALYLRHIHDRPNGHRLSPHLMAQQLRAMGIDFRFTNAAIESWLSVLATQKIVRRGGRRHGAAAYRVGAVAPRVDDEIAYVPLAMLRNRGEHVPDPATNSRGLRACGGCGRR